MNKKLRKENNRYNDLLKEKFKPMFEDVVPVTAFVCFASSIVILFSKIPKRFAVIDIIAGIIFTIMALLKNKIKLDIRLFISIILAIIMGTLTFFDAGFNSSAITLFLLANLTAVVFLDKHQSLIVSIVTVCVFIAFWVSAKTVHMVEFGDIDNSIWIIQFVVFSLFLLLVHGMINSIRMYFNSTIEEIEDSKNEIEKIAFYDYYTGLPNYRLFIKRFEQKNKNDFNNGYVIIFRIDNLDVINTVYSENLCNKSLIVVKNAIQSTLNDTDILAINNRKEFIVWVEDISKNRLMEWFGEINRVLYGIELDEQSNVELDIYISYATYINGESTIEDCYKKASLASVYAKVNGLDGIIAYNKEFDDRLYKEEALKKLLSKALKQQDFDVFYQPKVDIVTGKTIGVEALARWNDDTFGYVEPSVFIPIIEKTNQTVDFDEIIIDKVLKDYSLLCDKYNDDITVAINISPSHMLAVGFAEFIDSKIKKYGINPDRIVIELTEEVLIQNEERAGKVLADIRKMNIGISLDDFGSGFSSYNYLVKFDIDELKIDKCIVDHLCASKKTTILLESIIYIAKNYNLRLVAEGVETEEQKDMLMKLGLHLVQGYLYGRPEPLNRD